MAIAALASTPCTAREEVILLHGLCRTSRSMMKMQSSLEQAGFKVRNVNYPSRSTTVEKLADTVVGPAVADCRRDGAERIDFVAHSLGAILIRSYLARHTLPELGRVVMLGPPNQGSEIVDKLGGWSLFKAINGVAGTELGTHTNSEPVRLGPVAYPVGIIAGDRSINWINSCLIPGPDDGKVSVQRAKLDGMTDFIVLHTAHPFIMRNRDAIRQTIRF